MNIIRVTTLLQKECLRFLRVYNQTIISPVVNGVILFIIFTFAFARDGGDEHYKTTVAIGMTIMIVLQASYLNTQSTITVSKVLGFIKDYTITPLTKTEIMLAFCLAGCLRGIIVGALTFGSFAFFCEMPCANIFIIAYYFIIGMILFAILGIIIGFSSPDFDKSQAYYSYIIAPLTMLSGTFYSIDNLPPLWQKVILFNPVFYIIEGFRNGILGVSGKHEFLGFAVTALCVPVLLLIAVHCLKTNLQKIDY